MTPIGGDEEVSRGLPAAQTKMKWIINNQYGFGAPPKKCRKYSLERWSRPTIINSELSTGNRISFVLSKKNEKKRNNSIEIHVHFLESCDLCISTAITMEVNVIVLKLLVSLSLMIDSISIYWPTAWIHHFLNQFTSFYQLPIGNLLIF